MNIAVMKNMIHLKVWMQTNEAKDLSARTFWTNSQISINIEMIYMVFHVMKKMGEKEGRRQR